MKTNSKDVVKNVESNNVESTSNEQRQTNKPIVISRRRLLRAGVAGIPVVLTMAGVAPGIEGINAASAASGMNYDHLGTVGRISPVQGPDANGLIWSDEDGFVLTSQNGDYYTQQDGLSSESGEYSVTLTNADPGFIFVNSDSEGENKTISTITLNLSLNEGNITGNPRLHKLGNYYISNPDVSLSTLATSQLTGTAGEYTLSGITLDNSQQPVFDLDNWDKATDKNSVVWYLLTDGAATSNSTIKSVTIKVESLSFSDGTNTYTWSSPSGGTGFTFSNIAVDLPTKLN